MSYPDIKKIPPKTIIEFRNYSEPQTIVIPELSKYRKCTDVGFLIFLGLSLLVTVGAHTNDLKTNRPHFQITILKACIIGVTMKGTDYNRFLNGYDKCGDTCDAKNVPIRGIKCSGKDLRGKPIVQLKIHAEKHFAAVLPDRCVQKCPPENNLYFHRCFPATNATLDGKSRDLKMFLELVHNLKLSLSAIGAMCLTGLVLTLLLFVCFWLNAHTTLFSLLIMQMAALFGFTTFVWYCYIEDPNRSELLYVGIVTVIIACLICICVCYFYDRYNLIVYVFSEAVQGIFRMPYLLLQPLLTLFAFVLVISSLIFLSALASTKENLVQTKEHSSVREYELSTLGLTCIVTVTVCALWIIAMLNGCQCMVVSGAVAAQYFTRDKYRAHCAYFTSMYVLFRYHMGTVAGGSLVITVLVVARFCIKFLGEHMHSKHMVTCLECCLTCVEQFVDYLSKKAYIQTAMHGKPLYESGMRAARLLWSNLLDTIALDTVGDFILFCSMVLILISATAVGIIVNVGTNFNYYWIALFIGLVATGTIVYFYMQVLNVAIDTIFICFCEDKLMNDGERRPYYMSPQLASTIDNAKKAARQREN